MKDTLKLKMANIQANLHLQSQNESFEDLYHKSVAENNQLREALEGFVISVYKGCTKDQLNRLRIKAEQALNKK